MKITEVKTCLVSLPLPRPFITSMHYITASDNILVEVHTDEGITGLGHLFSYNRQSTFVLKAMVEDLREVVLGEDAAFIEKIWQKMWRHIALLGHKGVAVSAMSAIDVALWDLKGKAAQMPLYKLLGGYRERVPAYGSGGALNQSIPELVEEATGFLKLGLKAYKMKIGSERPEEDVARVRAVREALGQDALLMVDGNQKWTAWEAIQMARRLEKYDIYWLEEPVPAYDVDAHAQVAAALEIPIATGENEYTKLAFRQLIDKKAADILTPNLQRMGGITEWRKLAALAESYHLPIASHIYMEIHSHLMAAIPNGLTLEYIPWWTELFNEALELKEGCVVPPQGPGLGLSFKKATIDKYRIG